MVALDSPAGPLQAYVSGGGDAVTRGIIIAYDVYALQSGRIRGVADTLAAAGFLVVVPDIYEGSAVDLHGGFPTDTGKAFVKAQDWPKCQRCAAVLCVPQRRCGPVHACARVCVWVCGCVCAHARLVAGTWTPPTRTWRAVESRRWAPLGSVGARGASCTKPEPDASPRGPACTRRWAFVACTRRTPWIY